MEPELESFKFLKFLTPFVILFLTIFALIRPRGGFRFWCNCEICDAYLNLKWTKKFHNLCDWYTHLLKISPTKTIHIHVLSNTITANPENVEYILKTNFDNFPKGKPFSAILGDFLGRGIFNVDGSQWKFQKKMASLELDRSSIRSYAFEIVNHEIEHRLIPVLSTAGDQNQTVDLQDIFRQFSFHTICRFSFGLDPNCLELSLPMSEFAVAFDLASKLSAQRAMTASPLVWKIKRWLNIGPERELKAAIKLVNVLAKEVIRKRRKTEILVRRDLLSRFMCSLNDETYLRDIVISFLLAGRDSVASTLTSLFWLLGKHPNVVLAIKEEADRVLGCDEEEALTFEKISQLCYLQATIYESMRLYPPIQFDSKFCQSDDTLPDKTFVRKGTRVTYHPYAMGRMEEIWGSDCLEFKPERWLKDGVFSPENPFKYPVFQAGYRVCLGKEMALVELKCVAVTIVRGFDIELAPTQYPTPRFSAGLTATFSGGLPVTVRKTECAT